MHDECDMKGNAEKEKLKPLTHSHEPRLANQAHKKDSGTQNGKLLAVKLNRFALINYALISLEYN